MSRINTNISSIVAQRVLGQQNTRLNQSLQRLSTGLRINTGKDDPAGLIASETMRAEMRAIQAAQTNISRATNVVAVAESGLAEVQRLLNDLEDLVDRTSNEAGISVEERNANQQEIDLILSSINRIANSTELQGRRLLSGDLDYSTSGVNTLHVANLRINSARVPEGGSRLVNIDVLVSAQLAQVGYRGGTVGSAQTIEITGNLGSERITLTSGATTAAIVSAINMSKHLTGVSAVRYSNTSAVFYSTAYGSSQYVKVRVLQGANFQTGIGGLVREDFGQDVRVNINGEAVTGDGLRVSVRNSILDIDITLTPSFATQLTTDSAFAITGGGAQFMISPRLDLNSVATIGIGSVTTANLGDRNIGYLFSLGSGQANAMSEKNFFTAQRIVRAAQQQVANLRGRLGSFQKNTLETTAASLRIQYENVASAESTIRDTDFAEETSNLTRSQILVQSATNVLRLSNAAPQQVLALLQ